MIRYLKFENLLALYSRVMETSGGLPGIRDLAAIESALTQPQMHSAVKNYILPFQKKQPLSDIHSFKIILLQMGINVSDMLLLINGFEISCPKAEQEEVILNVASSTMSRDKFEIWLAAQIVPILTK